MWLQDRPFAIPARPVPWHFPPNGYSSQSMVSGNAGHFMHHSQPAPPPIPLPTPPQRRKRASKPKVRTGCTTCKIRRIKCDETKPNCKRCTSTGRKCDGYEFPREEMEEAGSTSPSPPPKKLAISTPIFPPTSLSQTFTGDAQERRIFYRFQIHTIPAFAGGSEGEFWTSLVLKVGQQEPVVRNAIIALGTLHEDYQLRGGIYSESQIQDPKHQHALQLYGNALRQLNKRLNQGDRANAKLALISSILFTCFEVLRRNNMAAVIHYQAGLRELIRQMNLAQEQAEAEGSSAPTVLQIPQTELDELLRVFARYDIQACTFSKPQAERLKVQLDLVPPTSFTLAEVRRHLDSLLISVYQLVKSSLGMHRYWEASAVPLEWRLQREEAIVTFEGWLSALENFFNTAELRLQPAEVKSLLGLRMQIKVAIIMLKTCIDSGPEKCFDVFHDDFEDIVARIEKLTISLQLVEGQPLDNESTSFTMELGIIHPLFFVATKCRHWILRRRAIAQLKKSGREGVWEGPIMALVAERVVEIEEQGVEDGDVIPERNRLHEIRKNVDYESRRVLVEAMRARDGTWKHWETLREVVTF